MGEQFFFCVNSDAAVLIILRELSSNKTKIEVISCSGGGGLLSISYAAHSAYVHDVKNFNKIWIQNGICKRNPLLQRTTRTCKP